MAKKHKKKPMLPPKNDRAMKRALPPMRPGPNEFDAGHDEADRAGALQARAPMPPMDEPDMGGL